MQTLENKLKKIIAVQLNIPEDEITPSSRFVEDLGCDSLDLVELAMSVEEYFDIEITTDEELEKIKTVQDAVDGLTRLGVDMCELLDRRYTHFRQVAEERQLKIDKAIRKMEKAIDYLKKGVCA